MLDEEGGDACDDADATLRGTCQFPPPDLVRTMMDPEKLAHWQAADAAFDQCPDLPQPERDAWLATQPLPAAVPLLQLQLSPAHQRPRASLDPTRSAPPRCHIGPTAVHSARKECVTTFIARS